MNKPVWNYESTFPPFQNFLKNCIILPFCFMNTKPSLVMEMFFLLTTNTDTESALFNSQFPSTIIIFVRTWSGKDFSPVRFCQIAWVKTRPNLWWSIWFVIIFDFVEKPVILLYQWYLLLTVKWLLQRGGLSMSHAITPKSLPTMQAVLSTFSFLCLMPEGVFITRICYSTEDCEIKRFVAIFDRPSS